MTKTIPDTTPDTTPDTIKTTMTPAQKAQRTAINQQRFIKAYEQTYNVTTACQMIRIARTSVYEWIDEYPEFARMFAEVRQKFVDDLEAEAVRRAMQGSDRLIEFLLRSHRPTLYGQHVTTTATITNYVIDLGISDSDT